MFTSRFQRWVRRRAEAVVRGLARLGITPNQVTIVGMLGTFVAAVLAATGRLLLAGIVLALVSTFDILDGALARVTATSGNFGAFLDSTIDRYMEGAIYLGLAAYFLRLGSAAHLNVLACVIALIGSFQVSYARARAQSLDYACETGLFKRPERVVAIVAGLVLSGPLPWLLPAVVWLLAIVTNFTALQRINEVWQQAHLARTEVARERREEPGEAAREPEAKRVVRPMREPGRGG
jgi:CDP-diacylglycerol--glycerol-3-phosphate 3-phosphatidyltransferase